MSPVLTLEGAAHDQYARFTPFISTWLPIKSFTRSLASATHIAATTPGAARRTAAGAAVGLSLIAMVKPSVKSLGVV